MATNKNRITFQASDELKDILELCAKDREQSVSALIVGILRDYLLSQGYLSVKKQTQATQTKT
ncbi:ribbon-helix-helix domain-containing protein [Calothrix sp. UHCC 0171]|uniref:ribbon-helix-helix domain-containing protein n=1 Tax=Calothrix sp. UHCC 0171 TaxID=3110245 RepID=UPI002B208DE5|nr:ribbon-helix-helix domain-containing protein [Calothrix sp. UHCC 0171]MEA5574055.1 ribbon-helix-helix domain-containing protein [Calothrix sp. UHCC 0171]